MDTKLIGFDCFSRSFCVDNSNHVGAWIGGDTETHDAIKQSLEKKRSLYMIRRDERESPENVRLKKAIELLDHYAEVAKRQTH